MNTFTINDIRKLKPCYDPTDYLPETWTGTALDILRVTECPAQDRLWVVLREGWIDGKTLRLFAVWCAREALKIDKPDPRSVAVCDVAERYASGDATEEELDARWNAARHATCAAWNAAMAAAKDAAWNAAMAAAWDAAGDAAWNTARDAQIKKLLEMLDDD